MAAIGGYAQTAPTNTSSTYGADAMENDNVFSDSKLDPQQQQQVSDALNVLSQTGGDVSKMTDAQKATVEQGDADYNAEHGTNIDHIGDGDKELSGKAQLESNPQAAAALGLHF